MNIDKATIYFRSELNKPELKLLPQNVKKTSKPASLVNKYGNGDPNSIIWLYDPRERYVGMLIKKSMLEHDVVLKWVNERERLAGKGHNTGKEYMYIPF